MGQVEIMIKIYKLRDFKWLTICKREFKIVSRVGPQNLSNSQQLQILLSYSIRVLLGGVAEWVEPTFLSLGPVSAFGTLWGPVCYHTHLGGPGPMSNRIHGTSRVTRLSAYGCDHSLGRCDAIVYARSPKPPAQVTGLRYGIAKQRFTKHLKMQLHFSSTTVLENWIFLLDGWAYLHLMF